MDTGCYSFTHVATVGVKGLNVSLPNLAKLERFRCLSLQN